MTGGVVDSEDGSHRLLHAAGGPDFEQEDRFVVGVVAHDVDLAARHGAIVARREDAKLPTDLYVQRPRLDPEVFVLTNVRVPRDGPAGVEANLHLQELPVRLLAGLHEPEVLPGAGIV